MKQKNTPAWIKDVAWYHYSNAYDALPSGIRERFPKMPYGEHANEYNKHLGGIKQIRWIESERALNTDN